MKTGKPKLSRSCYTVSLKKLVVMEYKTGLFSRRELAEKYCITDQSSISQWLRIFGGKVRKAKIAMNSKDNPERRIPQRALKTDREYLLEERIRKLERQLSIQEEELRHSKLQAHALDKMIDIAEDSFNIQIRKKPGTKQ
nr:hypothetical protein [uncultured Bacteroides sp.]